MKIKVTNLLVFDEHKERERIEALFGGADKAVLLDILDRFIAGKFEELGQERLALRRELAECLHPTVDKVLCAMAARSARSNSLQSLTAARPVSGREAYLLDLSGMGDLANPVWAQYPAYDVLPHP